MAKQLVTDKLWETIEPLLPPEPPKSEGGRPSIDDRAALTGIVFVLKSGIPWEMLPQEMGCGSGMTCWRRLKEWQEAGVWERLHLILLDCLGEADQIEWERASLDSASIPAKRGAQKPERIRRIKERRARSATLFRTEKGSRALCDHHRSQRPRLDGLRRTHRRPRAHQASSRQAEEASREAACRQSLRRQKVQRSLEKARDKEPYSKKGHREQREVGSAPVGCGAHTGLAFEVPQAHDSL
jgi:transposase